MTNSGRGGGGRGLMAGPWDPRCAVTEALGPEARPGGRKGCEEEGESHWPCLSRPQHSLSFQGAPASPGNRGSQTRAFRQD